MSEQVRKSQVQMKGLEEMMLQQSKQLTDSLETTR